MISFILQSGGTIYSEAKKYLWQNKQTVSDDFKELQTMIILSIK